MRVLGAYAGCWVESPSHSFLSCTGSSVGLSDKRQEVDWLVDTIGKTLGRFRLAENAMDMRLERHRDLDVALISSEIGWLTQYCDRGKVIGVVSWTPTTGSELSTPHSFVQLQFLTAYTVQPPGAALRMRN